MTSMSMKELMGNNASRHFERLTKEHDAEQRNRRDIWRRESKGTIILSNIGRFQLKEFFFERCVVLGMISMSQLCKGNGEIESKFF